VSGDCRSRRLTSYNSGKDAAAWGNSQLLLLFILCADDLLVEQCSVKKKKVLE
jgi:hypothetical protein